MGKIYELLAARGAMKRLATARALLEEQTPLKMDCGKLCDGACCKDDETSENGMLLYPYEDRFYRKPIAGFAYRLCDDDTLFKGGKRLVCEGDCPREARPLRCRIFPLRIKIVEQPDHSLKAKAELEPAAWAVCPLCEQGMSALSQDFIAKTEQAGDEMLKQLDLAQALFREQDIIDQARQAFGL